MQRRIAPARKAVLAAAVLGLAGLGLSACGADAEPGATGSSAPAAEEEIAVTLIATYTRVAMTSAVRSAIGNVRFTSFTSSATLSMSSKPTNA